MCSPNLRSHRVVLHLLAFPLALAPLACGDDHKESPVSATDGYGGAPDDPSSTTSTGSTGGETEGTKPEVCPGYHDACLWDSDEAVAGKFQCEGTIRARFDANSEVDKVADEFPVDVDHSFGSEPYAAAEIIACCSDDYLDGCPDEELLPPQVGACLNDCAQQSCIGLHAQIEAIVDGLPLIVKDQGISLQNYVATHIAECTKTLRMQEECDVLAAEHGTTFEDWCEVPHLIRGRWRVPDSDEWPLLTGMSFDLECEINDVSHPVDAIEVCSGVQGNNDDPPLEPLIPQGDLEVAELLSGVVSIDGSLGSGTLSIIDGEVELIRASCASGAECPVKLRGLALSVGSASLGEMRLADARLHLRSSVVGIERDGLISFGNQAINAHLSGTLIDDELGSEMSIGVGLENVGDAWMSVSDASIAITALDFVLDAHQIAIVTAPAALVRR